MAIFVIAFMLVFSSWDHGQNDLIGPIPPKPDYSDSSMWYIRDRGGDADIFYVISTETGDHMIGNDTCHFADVRDSYLRGRMEHEMHAVDSFYSGRLNYFSPYYRQASMQSWATEELAMSRIPLPMKDCVESFQYYIEHFNQSRPFILAGFSQGSYALVEIMKQMPDSIAKRMVAAYCIGYKITRKDTASCRHLHPAQGATDTGVTICFNSAKTPNCGIPIVSEGNIFCINPVNWRTDTVSAPFVFYGRKQNDTLSASLDPQSRLVLVSGYTNDKPMPVIGVPGNYHHLELKFYYPYIRQNMADRVDAYYRKQKLSEQKEILFRHMDTPWMATDSGFHNQVLIAELELKQGRFVLDLERVGTQAEVCVNGQEVGKVTNKPFRVDVTNALRAGKNEFIVRFANQQVSAEKMTLADILLIQENRQPYTSIRPGEIWLDTNGKPIQAHGFQVMEQDGVYYWYGENKERTVRGSHVWTWGIRCYKSTDLYNWEDCGLIIPPDTTDYLSPLHYTQSLDRPHIIHCKKTGKYVCWIKSMDEDGYFVILQADNILGPYKYVRSLKPEGFGVGDFDLYADPETGKGYVWFERPHWELICADLSDDYTDVTPVYSSHFVGKRPPYTREAPTHFVYKGKHYLFTSGTTGYYPNVSMIASFDDYHGKYKNLGNPHPTDPYNHSFGSQITDVVKIPGRDLFVAVADRWMPQITNTTEPAEEVKRSIPKYKKHKPFPKDFSAPKPKDKREKVRTTWDVTYNATYVFLPIVFKKGKPQIEWKEEWRIEDF